MRIKDVKRGIKLVTLEWWSKGIDGLKFQDWSDMEREGVVEVLDGLKRRF